MVITKKFRPSCLIDFYVSRLEENEKGIFDMTSIRRHCCCDNCNLYVNQQKYVDKNVLIAATEIKIT